MTDLIQVRDGAFGYADRPAVAGVNLTVRQGDVIAILGPNGSGKSTLVKGILGLTEQFAGDVTLFGQPRAQFHDFARLGYVPQRHTLSASVRATATEIVATGRLARRPWYRPANATDHELIDRALDVVGLGDRAKADVATLSGGQQRRVLIARALAGQPDVLLMDEPTAGVDADNQHVLAQVLERLVEQGTTMVIVTHEPAALTNLLTRIVVVDSGRVTFDGSPAEYAQIRESVHHDHDSHHHDDELTSPAAGGRRLPVPTSGPLDPGAHRG